MFYEPTEEILASLTAPVAIVGNGPITGRGEEIDGCGSVIRINSFRIRGFERDVGRRITAWCIHGLEGKFAEPLISLADRLLLDNDLESRWIQRFTVYHPDVSRIDPLIHYLARPLVRWSEVARGLFKPRKPSTGLMLILAAMYCCRGPIRLYGFDGMRTGHYWNPDHQHDHPEETAVLARLTTLGDVTWVDP